MRGGCGEGQRVALLHRFSFSHSNRIHQVRPDMNYGLLADLVLTLHAFFVVFAVLGGLVALRWRRAVFVHIPCALWGAWVALAGWICPLTPLEVSLRQRAGEGGYAGGFLEQYLVPILYPGGLTRGIQIGLGVFVLVLNIAIYAAMTRRWRRSVRGSGQPG